MSNKSGLLRAVLCVSIFSLGVASTANAALESRLGGKAVYDTDRNITWLANANAAAGSSFDDGFSPTDGLLTWFNANRWVASLSVDGITGWRLPTTDPTCTVVLDCRITELGHLFYSELGGSTGVPVTSTGDPDLALFTNLQPYYYWSGTLFGPNPYYAWSYNFGFGNLSANYRDFNLFALAVHSGDVGLLHSAKAELLLVPEPQLYTMLLVGLGSLGFIARRYLQAFPQNHLAGVLPSNLPAQDLPVY